MSSLKLQSFLSPYVRNIFVGSHEKSAKFFFNSDSVSKSVSVKSMQQSYAKQIKPLLKRNLKTSEDFVFAAENLCLLFYDGLSMDFNDEEIDLYSKLIGKWLDSVKVDDIRKWFLLNEDDMESKLHLFLLQITSSLEYGLGNLYMAKEKPVPFLLKDLIRSRQLSEILSEERMYPFLVLFDGPLSLNLRNLLWHGFLLKGELPKLYFHMILFFLIDCSVYFDKNKILGNIIHRRLVVKTEEIHKFKDCFGDLELIKVHAEEIFCLLQSSPFIIPEGTNFLFKYSFELFKMRRFGDCATILLPRIESLLRCRYVWCNDCPDRVLTAQSSEFYTTIDEVLVKSLKNGSKNKLRSSVGDDMFVVLMDLFSLPDGIRLRDHLSHGEMSSQNVDEALALALLVVAVVLAHQPPEGVDELNADSKRLCGGSCSCHASVGFTTSWRIIQAYPPQFHPLAISKHSALSCLRSCLDVPPVGHPNQPPPLCETFRSMTSQYLMGSVAVDDASDAIEIFRNLKLQTLFRDHPNNVIIRMISYLVLKMRRQVDDATIKRVKSFERHEMRSRQRKNFQRLISSLPLINEALKLLSCFILSSIHDQVILNRIQPRKLKAVLQICENCVTFTSVHVNKWDECMKTISKLSDCLPT